LGLYSATVIVAKEIALPYEGLGGKEICGEKTVA
jgi:hypothetical protein